jgi:hypothetical protein
MKERRHWAALGAAIGLHLIGLVIFTASPQRATDPVESVTRVIKQVESPPSPPADPRSGDRLLAGYGSTNTTVRDDLRQIHRVFENALVLVKRADTRYYATNEDLADFLRGNNPDRMVFVSPTNSIFGADGRILDRWGQPLRVHPLKQGAVELRSAGRDGIAWNADDVMVDSPR